jgi:nucleotide-binding universal stress UspA family protein
MRNILVAVDGSAYSEAAVRVAAELVRQHGAASLTLLNVIEVVPSDTGPVEVPGSPADPEAWAVFAKPREILAEAGIQPKLLLREGDPANEIVEAAKVGGYELIVVGHRGLSPIKAFLLGSVSDRVVAHAPCSVLVVRPGLEAKA